MTEPEHLSDDKAILSATLAELRSAWRTQFGDLAPAFRSRDLLARAFIYWLETARHGGIKPALRRRLTELTEKFATNPEYNPSPRAHPSIGSALVREWNGVRHVVLVVSEGFQYLETTYSSLTQVAKVISGKHQSGPRFFGLVDSNFETEGAKR